MSMKWDIFELNDQFINNNSTIVTVKMLNQTMITFLWIKKILKLGFMLPSPMFVGKTETVI